MSMYTFNKIVLNNFYLYKDTTLPLNNQGNIIIQGIFDKQGNSNGAGKSMLFSPLLLLTHGIIPTGKLAKSDTKNLNVCLYTDIALSKISNKYAIKFDGKFHVVKDNKDITPHKQPEVLQLLKGTFPSEYIFNATTFVSQHSPLYGSIIAGTPSIRAKVIEEFIDQSKIENLKNIFKDKDKLLKESQKSIELLHVTLKSLKEELLNLKSIDIEKLSSKESDLVVLKKKINSITEKISDLKVKQSQYENYQSNKKLLKISLSKDQINSKIETLKDKRKKLNNVLKVLNKGNTIKLYLDCGSPKLYKESFTIPYHISVKPKYNGKRVPPNKVNKIISKYIKIEKEIDESKGVIARFRKLEGRSICPTCSGKIAKNMVKNAIYNEKKGIFIKERNLKRYLKKVESIAMLIDIKNNFIKNSISSKDIDLYKSNNEDVINKAYDKVDKEISFLESQLAVVKILNNLNANEIQNHKKEIDKYKNYVSKVKDTYDTLHSRVAELKIKMQRKKELLKKVKNVNKEIEEKEKSIKEDLEKLPIVHKILNSRDFKSEVLFDFCETLIGEWNKYSTELFDKRVLFELGKDQGYPSFKFKYGKKSTAYDLRFLSGGERKRFMACMIPSILMLNSSSTNVLIVDELDANVDNSGTEAILNFLPCLKELGKTSIFFLTAKSNLKHSDYSNWTVKRNSNTSILER